MDDADYKNILLKGCLSIPSLNYLATVWQAFKIIKKEKPEIVYAHDYFSALLVRLLLLLKRKHCKKIIYDAHELIIPEKGKDAGRRLNFFYKQEKKIVNKVDLLVCASEERGMMMNHHYCLKQPPVAINNISQLFISDDPTTVNILKSMEGFLSSPGITVVYAGVVTKGRRIDRLFEAVSELAPRFKLLIVGNGPSLEELKAEAAKQTYMVSLFTGGVPYKSLGAILSKCDIGFLYYPVNTLNNIYCASNKIYEYASVGLPMLANENPTVKKYLEEVAIGIATSDFKKGLEEVSEKVDTYKTNCEQFTSNNLWEKEAEKLRIKVKELA